MRCLPLNHTKQSHSIKVEVSHTQNRLHIEWAIFWFKTPDLRNLREKFKFKFGMIYHSFFKVWQIDVPSRSKASSGSSQKNTLKLIFKMGHPRPLFHLFSSFQTLQFLHQINVKNVHPVCRCWDSNSWPWEHESPPITTRPGLLPQNYSKTYPLCYA